MWLLTVVRSDTRLRVELRDGDAEAQNGLRQQVVWRCRLRHVLLRHEPVQRGYSAASSGVITDGDSHTRCHPILAKAFACLVISYWTDSTPEL